MLPFPTWVRWSDVLQGCGCPNGCERVRAIAFYWPTWVGIAHSVHVCGLHVSNLHLTLSYMGAVVPCPTWVRLSQQLYTGAVDFILLPYMGAYSP